MAVQKSLSNAEDFRFVLGIDIGSTKVCALLARTVTSNNRKTLEVIGLGNAPCDGVKNGNIKNLHKTRDAIRTALDLATKQAGFSYTSAPELRANINIGGDYFESRTETSFITRKTNGHDVKEEDIAELLRDVRRSSMSDAQETIHVLPLEFMIDNEADIFQPIGQLGRKIGGDFTLIKAQKSALKTITASLQGAYSGLNEDEFVLSPIASALSLLSSQQKEMGVALVDIGGGTTDIAIYKDGALRHVNILPFGGNHITSDIKAFAGISEEKAQEAKHCIKEGNVSACPHGMLLEIVNSDGVPNTEILAKNVALIIRARLREIAAMVNAEIKEAGFENQLPVGIVLTGGTTKINNIDTIFKEITGLHIQIGKPRDLEQTGLFKEVSREDIYATALGLAWAAIKPLDDRIDFKNIIIDEPKTQETVQDDSTPKKGFFKSTLNKINNFIRDDVDSGEGY